MEEKLAKFRAQKDREAYITKSKAKIKDVLSLPKLRNKPTIEKEILINATTEEQENLIDEPITNDDIRSVISDTDDDISCCSLIDVITYALWLVVWGTLYAVFIKLQFGTIYLIVSAIVFICFNTRTKPKRPNEISAYSVFNKDCKSIDGTLKAEQLERQLLFGRGVFHV
ncbi:putative conserved domain (SAYSvFN) [Popillia japonica]|uniref:Conserved domain (SAYSvFN) n=1 Tax=Popillia japonica TaxID=7064 RepID=A0AAW1JFH6_POPJA